MISCGEASGDLYAGALVRALRSRRPGTEVFGFGGGQMAGAGAELLGDYRRYAVTGLVEAASVLSRSWRMLKTLAAAARTRRPDVFVAIDFPDFNLRLLAPIHAAGIPIVYYVSPQLWAWRPGRIDHIRRYVTRMLVIFPFEQALYERAGVPVEFVGHPLIDLAAASQSREAFLRGQGFDPAQPVVALLPGSRANEVSRLLPVLGEAAGLIARQVPSVQFLVARAPSLDDNLFAGPVPPALRIVSHSADDVLNAADVVVTASGTATIQTALHGRPMLVVYRLSPLTYAVGRSFVRLSTYGMVNLVAGRPVVPELIQDACTPAAVAGETVSLLTDPIRRERMQRDLAEVRAKLGGPGASDRAAQAVLNCLGGPHAGRDPRGSGSRTTLGG
jgi:lipid-A-disaccharide synthase